MQNITNQAFADNQEIKGTTTTHETRVRIGPGMKKGSKGITKAGSPSPGKAPGLEILHGLPN